MIVDNIKNVDYYKNLSETFKIAFEYAKTMSKDFPCGRTDICDGLFVNVMEYEGKALESAKGEIHDNYIDIQFILSGSEKIGYMPRTDFKITVPYNKDNDIAFGEGNFEFVTLKQGDFLVAYPQDAHAPGVKSCDNKTKKAVFKLRVDKA